MADGIQWPTEYQYAGSNPEPSACTAYPDAGHIRAISAVRPPPAGFRRSGLGADERLGFPRGFLEVPRLDRFPPAPNPAAPESVPGSRSAPLSPRKSIPAAA